VQQQTELRSSLEAKLEMAEEVLAYSNSNIELTMQILIQVPKEMGTLLAKRADNAARISSLVELIREQVQSDDERQLLDAACPRWICVDDYEESVRGLTDDQGQTEEGAAAANKLLPLLLDNTSWKAFLEFLRAQMELVELKDDAKQRMANRTREMVRANQELKSIVAERKRVEERLSQLASIIELANDAIFIQTLGGTIVSWNKGAESIYGYSAREIVGRSRYMLVPPDQLDDAPRILERLTREERIQLCEAVHIRKDGKRINVSISVSPVKDVNGKIVGAAAITRDISDRKEAEERSNEALRMWEASVLSKPRDTKPADELRVGSESADGRRHKKTRH
jgi:PAS domain S-box-containing protein